MAEKPLPQPTPLTEGYWRGVANRQLELQRCQDCRLWIHFPELRCPRCGGAALSYELVLGIGAVESFSIVARSFVEGFAAEPYVIAWVELPEQPALRCFANIVCCDPAEVFIGMPVKAVYEDRPGFGVIAQFAPRLNVSTVPG